MTWKKVLQKITYLDHDTMERGAVELHTLARDQDVKAVLIGGSALHYFGSPRLTADVDFAATDYLPGLTRGSPLSFGGEKLVSSGGVPVDWVVRDDDYRDLYEAAVHDPLSSKDLAPVSVARPEYLLVMKMVADRGKDQADVEWLLVHELVDVAHTRRIVRRHLGAYALRDLESLEREAEWKKEKDR